MIKFVKASIVVAIIFSLSCMLIYKTFIWFIHADCRMYQEILNDAERSKVLLDWAQKTRDSYLEGDLEERKKMFSDTGFYIGSKPLPVELLRIEESSILVELVLDSDLSPDGFYFGDSVSSGIFFEFFRAHESHGNMEKEGYLKLHCDVRSD